MDGNNSMMFSDSLNFGLVGESHIAKWLRKNGYHVLPAYETDSAGKKGPRMYMAESSGHDKLIVPDMLAMRTGKFLWVEAKRKSCFSWYGKGRYWVDGIDRNHFTHYCHVQDETGIPVWLMFLHESTQTWRADVEKWGAPPVCPSGLWGNRLTVLRESCSHESENHGRTGMRYWGIAQLIKIAEVWQVTGVAPTAPTS